jgi:hypothetical protein
MTTFEEVHQRVKMRYMGAAAPIEEHREAIILLCEKVDALQQLVDSLIQKNKEGNDV